MAQLSPSFHPSSNFSLLISHKCRSLCVLIFLGLGQHPALCFVLGPPMAGAGTRAEIACLPLLCARHTWRRRRPSLAFQSWRGRATG
ncbi:hypothetical protein C8J57DRAFT_1354779 [Mycena rebaudengoi]|nr:hypothetical protein C8J57DRAFT_1354779 [Mycena rebaudengoi]